jgi:DNA-binding MarR family transcriptional regulator
MNHDLGDALYGLATLIVRSVPRELSLTAASTLAALERSGPQRITALAEAQGITQPSMTSLVTRLEEAGLVRRQADPLDGRVVLVGLADGGAAYVADRRRQGRDFVLELLGRLPEDELAALVAALPAIRRISATTQEVLA